MSELLSKVAEILNAPESLVQRSAEARAEASGKSVDEVLQSWAGGESVAAVEKTVEEPAPVEEKAPVEEPVPVEENDLPVKLPTDISFNESGNPLHNNIDWINTTTPITPIKSANELSFLASTSSSSIKS